MLSDTARKLLMIMTHSSGHHGHMPTMQELETKSGRTPDKIRVALQELVEQNYIEWQRGTLVESVLIIEGWERPDPNITKRQISPQWILWGIDGSNTDYWTKY